MGAGLKISKSIPPVGGEKMQRYRTILLFVGAHLGNVKARKDKNKLKEKTDEVLATLRVFRLDFEVSFQIITDSESNRGSTTWDEMSGQENEEKAGG